jgi:hypothetical protein
LNLSGNLVFPASSLYEGAQYLGDYIHKINFLGVNNNIYFSNGGGTRKSLTLASKAGYSGQGSEFSYRMNQAAFGIGAPISAGSSHLTMMGGDFTIGDYQTLVGRFYGHADFHENAKKLVVTFVDCAFTMGSTESYKLFGVSEGTGTITDNYT